MLARTAGIPSANGELSDGSHVVARLWYKGHDHYFDALITHDKFPRVRLGTFALKLDNKNVASYQDIVDDHYLFLRAGKVAIGELASYFGYHDRWESFSNSYHDSTTMAMTLRPNESITLRWQFFGKYLSTYRPMDGTVNGEMVYKPNFKSRESPKGVFSQKNVKFFSEDSLTPNLHVDNPRDIGILIYKIECPYAIVGGRIGGEFFRKKDEDILKIYISFDGKLWQNLWLASTTGKFEEYLSFDHLRNFNLAPPLHHYFIKVELKASGCQVNVGIQNLLIETEFQAYWPSLPGLRLGENNITYIDEILEPHQVTIVHRWKESSSIQAPGVPKTPIFPKNGAIINGLNFTFCWEMPGDSKEEIVDYEFFLSSRPDLAWPLAPNFETFMGKGEPELLMPEYSFFLRGATYYWRVRAKNAKGVWGPWGKVWRFTVQGPDAPKNLKTKIENRKVVLSWELIEGKHPHHYEVYASNEKGFIPSCRRYPMWQKTGQREFYSTFEPNLMATIKDNKITIVDEKSPYPLANKSFYRVIAVDEQGNQSTPSPYIEIKHPFIYSSPNKLAEVKKLYQYHVYSITSMGDLQYNRLLYSGIMGSSGDPTYPIGTSRIFQDKLSFHLLEAPKWMKIDEKRGLISGVPESGDRGDSLVSVQVQDGQGGSDIQTFILQVK